MHQSRLDLYSVSLHLGEINAITSTDSYRMSGGGGANGLAVSSSLQYSDYGVSSLTKLYVMTIHTYIHTHTQVNIDQIYITKKKFKIWLFAYLSPFPFFFFHLMMQRWPQKLFSFCMLPPPVIFCYTFNTVSYSFGSQAPSDPQATIPKGKHPLISLTSLVDLLSSWPLPDASFLVETSLT